MVRQWSLPNYFASKTQKIKNSSGQMRQISRRMEMIHTMIGWRRDEYGTHKHAHGSWILWSVSRVRSKTMHSLSCITSWLPYITLCYIDSRFFLPLEQWRRIAIAASRLCEAARWQKCLATSLAYAWFCFFCQLKNIFYCFYQLSPMALESLALWRPMSSEINILCEITPLNDIRSVTAKKEDCKHPDVPRCSYDFRS